MRSPPTLSTADRKHEANQQACVFACTACHATATTCQSGGQHRCAAAAAAEEAGTAAEAAATLYSVKLSADAKHRPAEDKQRFEAPLLTLLHSQPSLYSCLHLPISLRAREKGSRRPVGKHEIRLVRGTVEAGPVHSSIRCASRL
jgi:hypothetical protein